MRSRNPWEGTHCFTIVHAATGVDSAPLGMHSYQCSAYTPLFSKTTDYSRLTFLHPAFSRRPLMIETVLRQVTMQYRIRLVLFSPTYVLHAHFMWLRTAPILPIRAGIRKLCVMCFPTMSSIFHRAKIPELLYAYIPLIL